MNYEIGETVVYNGVRYQIWKAYGGGSDARYDLWHGEPGKGSVSHVPPQWLSRPRTNQEQAAAIVKALDGYMDAQRHIWLGSGGAASLDAGIAMLWSAKQDLIKALVKQ